jgi:molecular chaperone DnaJ
VNIARFDECPICNGTGSRNRRERVARPICKGEGQIVEKSDYVVIVKTCLRCRGEGKLFLIPVPTAEELEELEVCTKYKSKSPLELRRV